MLALFSAPPPQTTQTPPRLSLCLRACADTDCLCERRFPLPLLPPSSPPGTASTRSAASGIGGGGDGGGGDDDIGAG